MIVKLAFAGESRALDLRGFRVRAIRPSAPPGGIVGDLIGEALDNPSDGPPLTEIVRGKRRATVVVPDGTRKACLPEVLPVVLQRLRRAGLEDESITILVANGTHPSVGREALNSLLGPAPPEIRVLEHDCRSLELIRVGELRPGLPVRLHPAAAESDCLITVGTVRHHYFAGFGGGPKMVFPGLSGYSEIQANHALVLDLSGSSPLRHPRCEPGILDGNPVAEEIRRAAMLRPPDLALCLVEGRENGIAWASAGPLEVTFPNAVSRVRSWFEVPPEPPFNLMVAGAGGAPNDTTLIQAHKALDAACRFLEPGAELLWIAALDGGLGSEEMAPFVEKAEPAAILSRLSKGWIQYGHTALRIIEKTQRYRVHLCSRFDEEAAGRLGFEPVTDLDGLIDRWRQDYPQARIGVMPSAAVLPSQSIA